MSLSLYHSTCISDNCVHLSVYLLLAVEHDAHQSSQNVGLYSGLGSRPGTIYKSYLQLCQWKVRLLGPSMLLSDWLLSWIICRPLSNNWPSHLNFSWLYCNLSYFPHLKYLALLLPCDLHHVVDSTALHHFLRTHHNIEHLNFSTILLL